MEGVERERANERERESSWSKLVPVLNYRKALKCLSQFGGVERPVTKKECLYIFHLDLFKCTAQGLGTQLCIQKYLHTLASMYTRARTHGLQLDYTVLNLVPDVLAVDTEKIAINHTFKNILPFQMVLVEKNKSTFLELIYVILLH